MPNLQNLAALILVLSLSACASPDVDTSAPTYNETRYTSDLGDCRGGTAFNASLDGLGGAAIGSAFGALEGAYHGALAGDAPEGAIIGAVVGSVVGVVAGAYKPFKEQKQRVRNCLIEKGYVVES